MLINRHFLHTDGATPLPYDRSPNQGGTLDPRYLIVHTTAAASAGSAVAHFKKPSSRASAHLVIGRDGAITQLVPFDRIAWHAGRSRWMDLAGLNRYSIGIELDNAGELRNTAAGWTSWFGRQYPDKDVVIAPHQFDVELSGWHSFPEAQISAAREAGQAIVAHYGIVDVLGHDDIAPGRERDPGPAFPMENFRAHLLGRREDGPQIVESTAALNIRAGPGVDYDNHAGSPIAAGTRMAVEARAGAWLFVEVQGADCRAEMTGWVYGNHVAGV